MSSVNYCSQLDVSNMPTADNLTKESYITPDMQWSVLSLLNDRAVAVLDKESGAIENLPSVSEMLQTISNKMVYFSNAEKESMKKALNVMMEATEIAKFVVAAKVAYRNSNFIMLHQQLIGELNNQKMMITMMLNNLNAKNAFDQPAQQSSYFSWAWGGSSSPAPVQSYFGNPMQSVSVQDEAKITLQADFMNSVITNNDYKKMPDATQAANLLFKQCFIAQQQFAKNIIPLQLNNSINPSTYIYANFPEIYNKFSNNYPICQKIQDIVMHEPFRSNVTLPVTDKQQQAFAMLLQIRQAVQTAIDIANKKSSVNVGSFLPSSVVSYLDGIVSQLMKYDAHLSTLCKNPQFGATTQDIALSQEWSTFTKVAAGTAVAAAVIGTAWYFDVLPATGTKKTEGAVFGPENKKVSNTEALLADPKLLNVLAGGTKLGKDTKKLVGAITDDASKGEAVQDTKEAEEVAARLESEEQAAKLEAERAAQELAEEERIKEEKRRVMEELAADADLQLAELKKAKEGASPSSSGSQAGSYENNDVASGPEVSDGDFIGAVRPPSLPKTEGSKAPALEPAPQEIVKDGIVYKLSNSIPRDRISTQTKIFNGEQVIGQFLYDASSKLWYSVVTHPDGQTYVSTIPADEVLTKSTNSTLPNPPATIGSPQETSQTSVTSPTLEETTHVASSSAPQASTNATVGTHPSVATSDPTPEDIVLDEQIERQLAPKVTNVRAGKVKVVVNNNINVEQTRGGRAPLKGKGGAKKSEISEQSNKKPETSSAQAGSSPQEAQAGQVNESGSSQPEGNSAATPGAASQASTNATAAEAEQKNKDAATVLDKFAQASTTKNTEYLDIEESTNSILSQMPGLLSKAYNSVKTTVSDAASAQAKAIQREKDDAFAAKIGELERLSKEIKGMEGRLLGSYTSEEKQKRAKFYRLQEEVTTETARRKIEADRLENVRMNQAKLSSAKEEKIQTLKNAQIRLASQIKAQQDLLNNQLILIKTLEEKIEAVHGENNRFEDQKEGINLEIKTVKAKITLSEDRLNGKVDVHTKIKTQGLIELEKELEDKLPYSPLYGLGLWSYNTGMSPEDVAAITSRYNAAKTAKEAEQDVKANLEKKLTALQTKLAATEKAQATSNSNRQANIKKIRDEINKIIEGVVAAPLKPGEQKKDEEESFPSIKKIKVDLQALEQKKEVIDKELEDLEPSVFTSLWSKVSNYKPKTEITSKSFK